MDPYSNPRMLGEKKVVAKKPSQNEEENLEIKIGSFIYICNGRRKGSYGKVKKTLI